MIFLKTSPFLGFLALLIHQPIVATLSLQQRDGEALPLQKRRADKTYWLHPTCTSLGGGQFKQAIKEAIWVASRIPENLNAFDSQLANPGRLRWFYEVTENDRAARSAIAETFNRIGQITEIQDRKQAHIRILCNEDDDFKPVDGEGNPIPRPAGASEIKQTKYYNKEDYLSFEKIVKHVITCGSYIMGGALCSLGDTDAITSYVEANNNRLNSPPDPDQEPERYTIKFCNVWSLSMTRKQLPFTIRDFSSYPLDQARQLWSLGTIPMVILIHELSHVHYLSEQDFTLPSPNPAGAEIKIEVRRALDSHHLGTVSGYFMDALGLRQLMGSRGLSWRETIMNADSYGYFALIFRLREKQWEASSTGQGDQEIILFTKNEQLPDRGDNWPQ